MRHKILIIDADPAALKACAAALEEAGYAVATASDGAQALAREGQEQPDLVCVDLHLPGTDGIALCRSIKAARGVPVLLTASYLDDATSAGFATAGAEDLLFKPFDPIELVDKVAWYLAPEDAAPGRG